RTRVYFVAGLVMPLPVLLAAFLLPPLVEVRTCKKCKTKVESGATECPSCHELLYTSAVLVERVPDPAQKASDFAIIGRAIAIYLGIILGIGVLSASLIPMFAKRFQPTHSSPLR